MPEGSIHRDNAVKCKRRYRGFCVGGCQKATTYYCLTCLQFCHPECMPNMHNSGIPRVKHNKIITQILKLHADGHFDDIRPLKRSSK